MRWQAGILPHMGKGLDIAMVPVSHDLDVTTVGAVRDAVDVLVDDGCRHVVLNMLGCEFVDSAGMGMLVSELRRMRAMGGMLSLTHVSDAVYYTLRVLRLVDVMPVSRMCARPQVPDLAPGTLPLWKKTVAVDAAHMGDARRWVARLVDCMPFTSTEVFDMELAAGEAIGNAVDHTCAEGILATVSAYADRVVVDVEDCGCGMELGAAEEPPESESGTDERGRGISLMRMLADSVTIMRRPQGQGTLVRLVKMVPVGRD